MHKKDAALLFVGKSRDDQAQRALDFCRNNFTHVQSHLGRFGQGRLPEEALDWQGDYIISYLSPWVVPAPLLRRARCAALNFHPATPDYPGIGCNNFALYDNAREYGAMCHHMAPEVDTGEVVAVKRFKVFETDTVASILARTHDHQLSLFYDIMEVILSSGELPKSKERWSRKPYTRKELNALATITPDMSREEIARRVRATSFDVWKPTVELHGFVFELKSQPGD